MAFGISRSELEQWKKRVDGGEIAFLTHFWLHPKYELITSVTKVGCSDLDRLSDWVSSYGLSPRYIHRRERYPHFDLFGDLQKSILEQEGQWEQLRRFVKG